MSTTSLPYLDFDEICLEKKIGQGNALVYKATWNGKAVAVKEIDCGKNEIPREVMVHSDLPPHPYVLPLLGVAHSEDGFSIYICMELAETSLYNFLHKENKKPSLQQSTNWAMQIAEGMNHLHQHKLAHRDLKSANILLFEDEKVAKVCDFGSARVLERTRTVTGMKGTYRWMAPEFSDKASTKVNQLCDVFSYGMVLYEIFVHEIPYSDIEKGANVFSTIRDGKRPSLPAELPPHIKVLMQSCWKQNPHERPSFGTILQVFATTPSSEVETQDILIGWSLLHRPAYLGDADAVQRLIGNINIDSQTMDGDTALHFASDQGHISVVQVLVESLAGINLQNKDGITALYLASANGHVKVVQLLLQYCADINICSEDGISPLYVASQEGRIEVVDILLKSGADPNKATLSADMVPLEIAALNGQTQTVERLLEGGANSNHQSKHGCTALYYASFVGHVAVVQVLLQKQADVTICNKEGYNPLCIACQEGHSEVVGVLLKSGAHPDMACATSPHAFPLELAAYKGHRWTLETLLDGGANINHQDENGISSLYVASDAGHTDIVDTLLKHGADPNLATTVSPHSTPLEIAAEEGHTEIVEKLLDGGANINYQNEDGETALFTASRKNHVEIVQILLQKHLDVNICNKNGFSSLYMASDAGHTDVVDTLLKHGADPNLATTVSPHSTPLETAAEEGHMETVEKLLQNGAHINYQNEDAETALFTASKKGHVKTVQLLLQKHADVNICNKDGDTAMDIAKAEEHTNVFDILQQYNHSH